MKTNQLISPLRKNKDKKKKNVSKNTKKKTDNQTVLVTQQTQPLTQNNIQGLNQQSSHTTDPKANNNNQSSPKVNQSSPKVNQSSPPKNDIIPEYEKKKKMSDQLVRLCNDVLVLTQMVNNANTQKGNLIKQYKTVIRGIQSSFKNINDENVYRTKDHIF